ncbi:MAG: hypothetical protein OEY77_10465, partial [Nitrospira sp.]|nr:hypothetical protein [Nitrospira sp.]
MPVQSLAALDPNQFFNFRSTAAIGTHRLETGVSAVALSNDFSGRLSVTTAEGDTIRLAADLETNFRAGRYYVHGGSEEAAVSLGAESAHYTLQRDFGITVDGDLNEQELSDLEKLLKKISNIFHGFVEGQDEAALAQTASLVERFRGLATLSGLDLSVEVVRSVTVVAASSVTPGGASATTVAIPQLSNGTTAPTPSSGSSQDGLLTVSEKDTLLASLIEQVFEALEEAGTELQKFQKYLPDFFETLHEDLLGSLVSRAEHKTEEQDQ